MADPLSKDVYAFVELMRVEVKLELYFMSFKLSYQYNMYHLRMVLVRI